MSPELIAWKRLENNEDTQYMNIKGLDEGKGIPKIRWNYSKNERDEGKN